MAVRFVRVDLSDTARDFRPIAVEPGVPLLDRSQANSKILFRWLGGAVAEPEWEGDSVNFFVREEHGGRLEDVICTPASDEDLKGPLKQEVESLAARIEQAKPETSTERAVRRITRETFTLLIDDENRTDRDNYFFKYRDVLGRWRLVWCWGYQRIDLAPATVAVCTDPGCGLLFVRRPGQSPRCPSCEAALATGRKKKRPSPRRAIFLGLLLLLLGCLVAYWLLNRERLVATPKSWTGRAGSHVEFQVNRRRLFSQANVSHQAVAMSDDPRVIRFDHYGPVATARSPGKTVVRFYLGNKSTSATVTVGAAENPTKLTIEPELVELGIGTTAHLKLVGEYGDGSTAELTDAAEWEPKNDGVVFAHDGFLEGLAEGTSTVRARYRASPEQEYVEASANVSVAKLDFASLEMAVDPDPVAVGRGSRLRIDAVSGAGKKYSVLESSRLRLAVDPSRLATVEGAHVEGNEPGHGTLRADFDGLAGGLEFDVTLGPGVSTLVVAPERLDMVVGEIADLSIASPSREPIQTTSSDSKVVEVDRDGRLIARSEGNARVELSQGGETRTVDVAVTQANVESIAIRPTSVVVPVDYSHAISVMGRIEGGRQIELAPDVLTCEKRPAPRYADFDAPSMQVRGIWPTEKSSPESLAFRYGKLAAEAPVEVVMGRVRVEPPRREDQPVEVVILSDQGPAVEFPVGAQFDDFRIEAHYSDGFTRMVTKKATMTTDGDSVDATVSFSEGRMIGVRPGKTVVHAQFDGVSTKEGLAVAVTQNVDLDTIRLEPAPVEMLPGETLAMEAEGFKAGKSIGAITGLGGLEWSSDNEEVVRATGPSITGLKLGQGNVTARLGSVTSDPAAVSVVESIGADLAVDQDVIQLRVGESRRIGTDLVVRRGGTDLSRQCEVTPALPNVVRYAPETHSLVGVSPGVSAVTFAWGDRLATTTVEVLPGGALTGRVIVEPAVAVLSAGQAQPMRVFLVTPEGLRIDRTDSAMLTSSAPQNVFILANRACAIAPGTAEITAVLPEVSDPKNAGRASITVDDHPITAIGVDPTQMALSVGDRARLRIVGTSQSGTHELFPQPDLQVTAEGASPQSIRIAGSEQIDAVAPGSAEVAVRWQGSLSQSVPVTVTADPLTGLTIDPARATIHPGEGLVYQVTGMRGGRRRVLGPEDGVQLFTGAGDVAQTPGGMMVVGTSPGRTEVTAQVGSERAEAVLNVVPGSGPATGTVVVGGGPGYGYIGSDYIIRDGRRYVYRDGVGYVVVDDGGAVVEGPQVVGVPPSLGASALRFVPDAVRIGTGSPGARVRVVEVLPDGTLGRDVTGDPALEFSTPGNVATVERTPDGPIVRPVAPGETRVAARIGTTLFAEPELLVQVGDVPTGLARLDVLPSPLDLWSGEARGFSSVTVTPGPGQTPIDVSYSIAVPAGQGIVAAEPGGLIRGLSPGVTQVVIKVVEPGTAYDGLSTAATIQVSSPDRLRIEPPEVSLRVGEATPPFAVVAQTPDGRQYQVPAALESTDTNVLRPGGPLPGQFTAVSLGSTQVRAVYRNREMFATVTVTGERFLDVKSTLNEGEQNFTVTLEVLAAKSEGPLEYRAYLPGQAPADGWQPAEEAGKCRRVVLRSPPIPYGPRSARYSLTIEARSPGSGTVQSYPFTFRLAPNIERTDEG